MYGMSGSMFGAAGVVNAPNLIMDGTSSPMTMAGMPTSVAPPQQRQPNPMMMYQQQQQLLQQQQQQQQGFRPANIAQQQQQQAWLAKQQQMLLQQRNLDEQRKQLLLQQQQQQQQMQRSMAAAAAVARSVSAPGANPQIPISMTSMPSNAAATVPSVGTNSEDRPKSDDVNAKRVEVVSYP